MATKKQIETALKIKAYAERGEPHERDTARIMYEAYIKKHNIPESSLNNKNRNYDFKNVAEVTEFFEDLSKELDLKNPKHVAVLGGIVLAFALGSFLSKIPTTK